MAWYHSMYAYYVECGTFIRFNCFMLHEFKWHGTTQCMLIMLDMVLL